MTIQGPGHPVGHRPPQAPRALRPGGRPALTPRRPRRRRVGAPEGLRRTPTSAGCSSSRGWSAASTTGATSTTTRRSGRIDRLYVLWVVLTFGLPFLVGLPGGRPELGARVAGARVGRPDADLRVPARDVRRELGLPHVRAAHLPLSRREPQQLARRRADLRRGLAQQPPRLPQPRRATASTAASSTSPGGRSGRSSGSGSRGTCGCRATSQRERRRTRRRRADADALKALQELGYAVDPGPPARQA